MKRNEDTRGGHSEKQKSVLQARGKERQGREKYYRAGRCGEETGYNCAGNLVFITLLIKSFYFISTLMRKLEKNLHEGVLNSSSPVATVTQIQIPGKIFLQSTFMCNSSLLGSFVGKALSPLPSVTDTGKLRKSILYS